MKKLNTQLVTQLKKTKILSDVFLATFVAFDFWAILMSLSGADSRVVQILLLTSVLPAIVALLGYRIVAKVFISIVDR